MKNSVFLMVVFVTVWGLMLFEVLLVLRPPKKHKEIEQKLEYIQYMIFFMFPIACSAVTMQYLIKNPFFSAVIWVLIIEFSNRILSRRILCSASVEVKVAMSFLVMTLCAVYFGTQAIFDKSKDYCNMTSIILALIVGFFIPLDVLLKNTSIWEKGKEILDKSYLKEIKRGIWIVYVLMVIYSVVFAIMGRTEVYDKYIIQFELGIVIGVFLALPLIAIISKKTANSLKDCYDTRQYIFKSEAFERYRREVENYLNYTDKERYDYVEAFLFYKAYVAFCKKEDKYEADSMLSVCEHMLQEYSACSEMTISQRYSYNDNIFVLKTGKRKYSGDIMTSPWPLFKEYLRLYSEIVLEHGNVPKKERDRYASAGFRKNNEMWLLYFLENYHKLSSKKKKNMIPKELRSFLIDSYREKAMWLVPVGCNVSKMKNFVGESKIEEKYDFGDLVLMSIYEWYTLRNSNLEEATKRIKDCFGNEQEVVEACEVWLSRFKDWKEFVVANKLQKLVKKNKNIFVEKYEEPIMFFEGHSMQNMLPKSKKKWLKMFKKMSSMIYNRY